jgi:hypothetical protein
LDTDGDDDPMTPLVAPVHSGAHILGVPEQLVVPAALNA